MPPNQSNKDKSNELAHEELLVTPPVVTLASVVKLSVFATTDSISQIPRSVTKPVYDLEKSWILDSRATVHVCNDISKFNDYKPIKYNEEVLWVGDSQTQINGYGTIIMHLKSKKYPAGRPLTLKNVAFVPSLLTNVTSLRLLNAAGVHWDTEPLILKFSGRHYADTPMMFNQWVFEYNLLSLKECVYTITIIKQIDSQHQTKLHGNSSRSPRVQTGSFDDCYERMQNNHVKTSPSYSGDVRNIIYGKRQRKERALFHLEVHRNLDQLSAFHVAIQQGSKSSKLKLHKSQLPPPPENWYQLQYHPHREGFNAAAHLEFVTLTKQETLKPVKEEEVNPNPVKRVFTYKTDDNSYLLKYKARMVIRGDFQIPTEKDTYAATLAMRVNRAILAICAYFDLETHQFDVRNAFPHVSLDDDDEVVINYPEGFKVANHKLRV
ncbi:hypothetical protein K3495_g4629 [Podosphaera aphanis]|nr:hypothetical protein K3495_g4629 [Podosphaera aphanis]